jgi:hypothetical protein
LDSDLEKNKRKQKFDAKPSATVGTTTIQPEEPKDLEEGGVLFPFTNVGEGDLVAFYC